MHRIEALEGHHCSKHYHKHKYNAFFVEDGTLKVTVWKDSGTVDETLLVDGDLLIVPPGEKHRFEALQDTIAYEVYWTEFDADDIERDDHGQ